MLNRFWLGLVSTCAGIVWILVMGTYPAAACNKTDGCIFDTQKQEQTMKESGEWNRGILEGKSNIESFQRIQKNHEATKKKK